MKYLLTLLLLLSAAVFAQDAPTPVIPIGSHSVPVGERVTTQKPLTLTEAGATFVKVYFEPLGQAQITVRNADGSESYTYTPARMGKHTKHANGVWAALSVNGDTAIVEVKRGSVMVTHVDYGLAEPIVPETTCGDDNKVWIACHDATVRERARPVARITMASGGLCTAWRVGPGNMMMTNNHCVSTQEGVAALEVWFDYEYADCAATLPKTPFKLVGDTFLKTSEPYDYTLFTVQGSATELQPFGYFGLEPRVGAKGEKIYIVGHPQAIRKKGMVESDLNASGFCEIDLVDKNLGKDYGYWCDSEGGQSGSPVLTPTNGRAIALHHHGGCMNGGVKVAHIWPEIAEFFGGTPPVGDNETPGPAIVANINFDCVENVCQYSAEGSTPDAAYYWDFADGTFSEAFSGEHTYTKPAYYTVRLYVTLSGNTNATTKTVMVSVPGYNFPPVTGFTYTVDKLTVHFKSVSYDPEGTALTYNWRVRDPLDGILHTYTVAEFDHTFAGTGENKYADLRVKDADGVPGSTTFYQYITIPPFCGDGACLKETWETCPADCPAPIVLKYTKRKLQGPNYQVTFTWQNATGQQVKLYRGGTPTDTANDGTEAMNMHKRDSGTPFKLCDAAQCSATVRVNL